MRPFHIASLIGKPQGTIERYTFDEQISLPDISEFKLTSPVTGKVQFIKLPHEINVQITDLETVAETMCNRCLETISLPIKVKEASREFIIDLPEEDLQEGEDVFYIDKGRHEIALDEMIREEILLHFPSIPLCSDGCKGLCDQCGTNLNKKSCNCEHKDTSVNNPFKLPL